ncbi:SET domain-containing protein [Gyrodon lividus]|nr:SET domain-containing protein [Gyrodon lividus]
MSLSRRSSRSRSLHRLPSRLRPLSRDASSVDPLDIIKTTTHLSGQLEDESGQESIGGYRVVTWKSYVAEQRERVPEFKLAKDLPHSLQDHMSALPAKYRNSEIGRKVFEAVIRQATFGEPDAPPIEIFDNGVGDEVTPQWEFVYTNEMWLGEGVPPPDVKNLKSCGCVGKCDPKSKTCACAKRQLEWLQHYIDADIFSATWPGSPFVYDHRGILQRPDCPIFECNQFCSCDDDCPNRVVQHGRRLPVHIVKTMHKGWGVSAGAKKIPRGSYVGIYAGELLTEQEGEERGRYYDIYGRTYLFSVDFHHLKTGMQDPDDWDNIYVVDAYHAGNFTRFLNHSCDPNCSIYACYINEADVEKPLLVVFTTRDVDPWEELCFSYYGDIEVREKESAKDHAVYALCRCEADNCIGRLFT